MINDPREYKSVDLMELLEAEYLKAKKEQNLDTSAQQPVIAEFVKFAQDWLSKFPPVQVIYLDEGFGVRLQTGQLVAFSPKPEAKKMYDESMHITHPRGYPGQGPDIIPTAAVKII